MKVFDIKTYEGLGEVKWLGRLVAPTEADACAKAREMDPALQDEVIFAEEVES